GVEELGDEHTNLWSGLFDARVLLLAGGLNAVAIMVSTDVLRFTVVGHDQQQPAAAATPIVITERVLIAKPRPISQLATNVMTLELTSTAGLRSTPRSSSVPMGKPSPTQPMRTAQVVLAAVAAATPTPASRRVSVPSTPTPK